MCGCCPAAIRPGTTVLLSTTTTAHSLYDAKNDLTPSYYAFPPPLSFVSPSFAHQSALTWVASFRGCQPRTNSCALVMDLSTIQKVPSFVDLLHFPWLWPTSTSSKTTGLSCPHGLRRISVLVERDGGTKQEQAAVRPINQQPTNQNGTEEQS
jgi:hypothetical protein